MELRKIILALSIVTFTTWMQTSQACVDIPAFQVSSDINTTPPDFPLNPFVQGKLGVLSPKFGMSYLLTAYRYLNNQPLTQQEQNNLLTFWNWYFESFNAYPLFATTPKLIDLTARYSMSAKAPVAWAQPIVIDQRVRDDSDIISNAELQQQLTTVFQDYIAWRKLRLQVLQQKDTAPPLNLNQAKKPNDVFDGVQQYYNNQASKEDQLTLTNAVLTDGTNLLKFATLRLQKLNEQVHDPKILSAWIKTQQAIFKHLDAIASAPYDASTAAQANDVSEVNKALEEFPAQLPLIAQAEKDYFAALANFYTRDPKLIQQAADQFTALANNKNYPWHDWMVYLSNRARALSIFIEQSQQSQYNASAPTNVDRFYLSANQKTILQQAQKNMLQLATNAVSNDIKQAAQQYADIIGGRLQPDLFPQINKASEKITFQDLKNAVFTYSLGNSISNTNYSDDSSETKTVQPLPAAIQQIITANSDKPTASDWIHLYQISANANYDRREVFSYAYRLWKTNPDNMAWLLVAINSYGDENPAQLTPMIQAINNIAADNPGYIALRATLLQQDDKKHFLQADARKELIDDTLKNLSNNEDFRSKIFFLNERFGLTADINDLLAHAAYTPSARLLSIYPATTETKPPVYYLTPYSNALQQVPLSVLVQTAHSPLLSNTAQINLLANSWVRSVLLNDKATENAVADELVQHVANLAPYLKARKVTQNADERTTQFVSALLHIPYLTPQVDLTASDTWNADTASTSTTSAGLPLVLRAIPMNEHANYLWEKFKTNQPLEFLTDAEKTAYQKEIQQLSQLPGGTDWVANQVITLAKRHPDDQRYAELLYLVIKATHYADGYTKGYSKQAFDTLKQLYPNSSWAKQTKYYY